MTDREMQKPTQNGVSDWVKQWSQPTVILALVVIGASVPIGFYRLSQVEERVQTNRDLIDMNTRTMRLEFLPRDLAQSQAQTTQAEIRALRESMDTQFRSLAERLSAIDAVLRTQPRSHSSPLFSTEPFVVPSPSRRSPQP